MNSERNKKVGFKSSNSNFRTDSLDTMKLMSYSKVSKALYNKVFEYRKSTMVSYQNHRAFMCKDYKKDIFGRFAYDFELSQNILSFLI